ncbi:hydroxymethylglutaryl-CoA synthase family protein [Paenibacillus monticola]|uniref:3-hydroxy-3-methylglutaryl-ACP synthase n=1 Tax=Paenibacillus monticola TaxID=2666075 RepID=A0A7X2H1I6_9BACL|nr:hydroxymethylglutaryl-CoA synthase [Paenibacillus monticola]MRN51856.1 3-hydroxy-3-methylglutaryl-ACP synthase [Paenibacillus monticola]
MNVGIESINLYAGPAYIPVSTIFEARGLDMERFNNLMMDNKSMGLPCEDTVTNAVNAAKPIIDQLSPEEKDRIELVITASESGLDFGKSLSTYIHDYLGLNRNCRLFELKQACYGGTAALHMAACFVASGVSPGAKALVIASDVARAAAKKTYAEVSQAVGAVAMLISDKPDILELDWGATGYYGYEVMDTCRPLPEIETGDPDLSLLSYLDCLENSFKHYAERVDEADFRETFDYLVFHTPFAGMVKGGHRKMMRDLYRLKPDLIEADFSKRVSPSLQHCVQVGNIYSATVYMALCSLLDNGDINDVKRVGIFSYGSGCSSEFYSGIVTPDSQHKIKQMNIQQQLSRRYPLNMNEYDTLLDLNLEWIFGVQNKTVNVAQFSAMYDHFFAGRNLLVLDKVTEFHREYRFS